MATWAIGASQSGGFDIGASQGGTGAYTSTASTAIKEQRVWFSRVGDYEDYLDGTNDADPFSLSIPTTNDIRWVESLSALLVGTSGDEWIIKANELDTPLTPTNWSVKQQSSYGSALIQPVKINEQILFVDFVKRKVRELIYSDAEQKYVAPDLTVLSEHITKSGITSIAIQRNPDSILWCTLDDGSLVSMTYERQQDVVAWSKHPRSGTSPVVQSVCVVPASDEDEIWISIQRTINSSSVTYIEKFGTRLQPDDVTDCFYVESGITATPVGTTVSGLDHLEGETVVVLGDGEEQEETTSGDFTVSGGDITVPSGLTTCQIGLAYTYKLEPMRPDISGAGGTSHSSLVYVPEMGISFLYTMNAKYGVDDDNLYDIPWTDEKWTDNSDVDGLFTGDVVVSVDGGFTLDNNLIISGSDPLPCTVRALIPKMEVTGR